MNLTNREIDMIIQSIDLIKQWYGTTKEIDELLNKLIKMKEVNNGKKN